jgi:hypothetical protein
MQNALNAITTELAGLGNNFSRGPEIEISSKKEIE